MIDNNATEEFARDNRTIDKKIRTVCTTREEYYQTRGIMLILQQNTWKDTGQYNYQEGIQTIIQYLGRPLQFDPLPQDMVTRLPPRERTAYQIVKDWAMIPTILSYNLGKIIKTIIAPEEIQHQRRTSIDEAIENIKTPTTLPEKSYVALHPISGNIDRIGGILIGINFMIPAAVIGFLATTPREYRKEE